MISSLVGLVLLGVEPALDLALEEQAVQASPKEKGKGKEEEKGKEEGCCKEEQWKERSGSKIKRQKEHFEVEI